ncbi:MAG TPA: D-glycero-beta-D-manno-heptose 1-phosphate adenylyltransferase [Candidatus Omnitrophota bacterium]|nr:D-glycero-beta-D-manno-heptose 1-phosphate adenylyltransferase [Candidatus Omnitrophota bacterium]
MSVQKIKKLSELAAILNAEKKDGKVVGFTNGCFDVLHVGHVRYLAEARKECDILVVGVNSDDSVRRLKGPERPLNGQDERMEVLSALETVNYLVVFGEDTPFELINKLMPNILFKGGDWDESSVVGGDIVKAAGGKVKIIKYVDGYSTTGLIKKISSDKITGKKNGIQNR